MKKLIGMVDFVLNQGETSTFDTDQGDWYFKEQSKLDKIRSYANFLKQPLALWMFVPCDDDGNVIPDKENHFTRKELDYWEQAEERCLFKGFEVRNGNWLSNGNIDIDEEFCQGLSIESLVKYNLELTPTAQI